MVNVTLSISKEVHEKMKKHAEIRWSAVIRKSIEKKIDDLELLNKITGKSKLTKEDALEISNLINKKVAEKLFDWSWSL